MGQEMRLFITTLVLFLVFTNDLGVEARLLDRKGRISVGVMVSEPPQTPDQPPSQPDQASPPEPIVGNGAGGGGGGYYDYDYFKN
ncbi:hypothetical protein BVRB_4g093230 [Beta vulgaris subsp. vulgaris]|uniref:Uncharacterized protein n=1 Tax=Beta vulgaris subsp. vulgaris TaxID=3555 RepID=A0A0J8BEH9_BETVV|nr:hypothetical protein BVRB_4g093230 [Beta vulgaris subsp. vulgaris]